MTKTSLDKSLLYAQDLFKANVDALREKFPAVVHQLGRLANDPNRKKVKVFQDTSTQEKSQIEINGKWHWLDGPDNPEENAKKHLASFDFKNTNCIFIFGCGLGYLPREIYRQNRGMKMIIIEPRLEIFEESLKKFDWTYLFRHGQIMLFAGPNAFAELANKLNNYPWIVLSKIHLSPGCSILPGEEEIMKALAAKLTEFQQENIESTRKYTKEVNEHYQANPPGEPKKISLFTTIHNYLTQNIVDGFTSNDCDARALTFEQAPFSFINSGIGMELMSRQKPDAVMFLNSTPINFFGNLEVSRLPIFTVSWYLDNPLWSGLNPAIAAHSNLILTFDPGYLPYLEDIKKVKGCKLDYLHMASNCHLQDWDGEYDQQFDISFIGSSNFAGVQLAWSEMKSHFPQYIDTIDGIVEEASTKFNRTGVQVLDAFKENKIPLVSSTLRYAQHSCSNNKKKRFMKRLENHPLTIFGTVDWGREDVYGKLAEKYFGRRVDYSAEGPLIYRMSKININMFHEQIIHSTNPRIYDVLAVGGFLLCEYNPALEEEFEIGHDFDVFRTDDELMEKVDYYLAHDEEREVIARQGHETFLNNYTYAHRMKELLDKIRKQMNEEEGS